MTLPADFPRSQAHEHRAEALGLDPSLVTLAAAELTDDQIHWYIAGGLPYEGFTMYVQWALGPTGPRGACMRRHGRGAIAARISARLEITLSANELSDLAARHAALAIPFAAWTPYSRYGQPGWASVHVLTHPGARQASAAIVAARADLGRIVLQDVYYRVIEVAIGPELR